MRSVKILLSLIVMLSLSKHLSAQYVQPMRYDHYSFSNQVNIGVGPVRTTHASAYLEVGPTSGATKGFLPPRLTTTQRNAVASPAAGLFIYNSTTGRYNFYNGVAWADINTSTGVDTIWREAGKDSIFFNKNGITYAIKDSTGSTLSNIGSGYRLAVPGTNNVKTVYAVNGLTLDSTSNANALTWKFGGTLTDDTTLVNQNSKRLRFYGNETMFDSLRLTAAGETDYSIRHRLVGLGFPVATIKPTGNSAKNMALDIMPTGSPGNYSDNGIAWLDVCDSDISDGSGAVVAARVGVTTSAVQFGSREFGGATAKPIQFVIGSSTKAQIDASTNTGSFNIGKITQSQAISGDYVGYSLFNTNNSVAESNPIFFIGQDIGALNFGYIRWNNNATTPNTYRQPNGLEIMANAGATGGLSIGVLGGVSERTGKHIKFFVSTSEKMRIDSAGNVGIGTTTPLKLLHTNGTVRHASLGTASTDTTTYKPLGIDTNGDLIPMANWPQQKINLVFGAGSGADSDTTAFTTSAIYGSFYNDADTIVVTSMRAVLQGTSPDVTYKVWYNDSLNVEAGGTALNTSGNQVTNTTTGTNVTSFTVTKIPPGNWVWVKTSTVATKPKYFSLTINGYRK